MHTSLCWNSYVLIVASTIVRLPEYINSHSYSGQQQQHQVPTSHYSITLFYTLSNMSYYGNDSYQSDSYTSGMHHVPS